MSMLFEIILLIGLRSIVRNGNGTLGDTGMDDTYSGMGVRAILYPFYGLHHA